MENKKQLIACENYKFYIETYGCQMNQNDSEIISGILLNSGFTVANSIDEANIILLNTCSVRENAEEKIRNRIETLHHFIKKRKNKTILGIIGCMAARLLNYINDNNKKINNFDKFNNHLAVDLFVGPDEYRKLPELIEFAFENLQKTSEKEEKLENKAINLNNFEDYDDIIPIRNGDFSAFISIMRGCNNFCSYCVVPYTRGRERSRSYSSIIAEVEELSKNNFKEITLLGQNVNSYCYKVDKSSTVDNKVDKNCDKINKKTKNEENLYGNQQINFPFLLENVAKTAPNLRIRFLTSHPMDMSLELIKVIAKYENICNYIHLPIQSGSNRILKLMNRKYTVEHYLDLISQIKKYIPNCALSTDIIAGYPSETLEDHQLTLDLMRTVRYSSAFMFRYSAREGTRAFSEGDDVIEEEKIRRLNEIITLQNRISAEENKNEIGKKFEILVEHPSKKNPNEWIGRTKTFKLVLFDNSKQKYKSGDKIDVIIEKATSATLFASN